LRTAANVYGVHTFETKDILPAGVQVIERLSDKENLSQQEASDSLEVHCLVPSSQCSSPHVHRLAGRNPTASSGVTAGSASPPHLPVCLTTHPSCVPTSVRCLLLPAGLLCAAQTSCKSPTALQSSAARPSTWRVSAGHWGMYRAVLTSHALVPGGGGSRNPQALLVSAEPAQIAAFLVLLRSKVPLSTCPLRPGVSPPAQRHSERRMALNPDHDPRLR
jgi:hypothetical protein